MAAGAHNQAPPPPQDGAASTRWVPIRMPARASLTTTEVVQLHKRDPSHGEMGAHTAAQFQEEQGL